MLGPPNETHVSPKATVYTYSTPSVVVKVFNDMDVYLCEVDVFDRLKCLQGKDIPVVYATGFCKLSMRPFVILSNEGTCLRSQAMTDDDRCVILLIEVANVSLTPL